MFITTSFPAFVAGFPDVCWSQQGDGCSVYPIPFPSFTVSSVAVPFAVNVLVDMFPVHTLFSVAVATIGLIPPVEICGCVSYVICLIGVSLFNAQQVLTWGFPTQRLFSVGMTNLFNCPSATLSPSQLRVIALCL